MPAYRGMRMAINPVMEPPRKRGGSGFEFMQEYLERNGSRLQMDIENNNIISFSFKLPYASALKQARDKEWVQI